MNEFEDAGLTLRLFFNAQDAKHSSTWKAFQVFQYGPGALIKGRDGHWHDAHGRLPRTWEPDPSLLKAMPTLGFYVDAEGITWSADIPPPGMKFEVHDKEGYQTLLLVKQSDCEVLAEYVLHPSVQALKNAGVDITYVPAEVRRWTNQGLQQASTPRPGLGL